MTNGINSSLEDVTGDELAFWDIAVVDGPLILCNEGPPQVHDLEARTTLFGEAIILFAQKIPFNPVNNRPIDQLIGASTSIGANYCEADDGVSKADFKYRIGTCRKEARETKFSLRMIAVAEPGLKPKVRELWREAHELHLIFSRIWRSTKT